MHTLQTSGSHWPWTCYTYWCWSGHSLEQATGWGNRRAWLERGGFTRGSPKPVHYAPVNQKCMHLVYYVVLNTLMTLTAVDTSSVSFTCAFIPCQAHRRCYAELPSKVAACVPKDQLSNVPWAAQADVRRQAPFVSYALCAAAEALQAANWHPASSEDKAMTGVAIGVGMSSTQDIADAGVLVSQVRLEHTLSELLWSMAALLCHTHSCCS